MYTLKSSKKIITRFTKKKRNLINGVEPPSFLHLGPEASGISKMYITRETCYIEMWS